MSHSSPRTSTTTTGRHLLLRLSPFAGQTKSECHFDRQKSVTDNVVLTVTAGSGSARYTIGASGTWTLAWRSSEGGRHHHLPSLHHPPKNLLSPSPCSRKNRTPNTVSAESWACLPIDEPGVPRVRLHRVHVQVAAAPLKGTAVRILHPPPSSTLRPRQ